MREGHQEVTYKTTRLANEAGFPIYNNIAKTNFYNRRTASLIYFGRTGKQVGKHLYGCPTQELLAYWLRKIHHIHLKVECIGKHSYTGEVQDWRQEEKRTHTLFDKDKGSESVFLTNEDCMETLLILSFELVL